MRQLHTDSEKKYVRLYRMFSIASLYFVLSVCTSGIYNSVNAGFAGLLLNALLLSVGYFIMALWAKIIRLDRKSDSRGYESDGEYFSLGRALVPLIIIIVLGFFIMKLTSWAEYEYAMNTPGAYYEPDSLLPFFLMLFCTVIMAGGAVLWFVPYERLVSQRTSVACVCIMFIAFAFYGYLGGAGAMSGICLIGYTLSAALALNQNSLTKTYHGTVTAFLTPRARRYNMLLALSFTACVLVLMLGGYMIAVGLATAGKAILYIIVHSKSASSDISYSPDNNEESVSLFNMFVFGAKEANDTVNYWIFVFFAITVTVTLIIFLLRRQTEIRRLLESLKNLLLRLVDLIFSPVSGSMTYFIANMREDAVNYVDTEEKLSQNASVGGSGKPIKQHASYRDFLAGLRAAGDENARLRYAYSVFVRQLYAVPQFAKKSDTPRQLRGKLSRRRLCSDEEIAEITAAYEKAQYSSGADAHEASAATEKLCRMIRRNMD